MSDSDDDFDDFEAPAPVSKADVEAKKADHKIVESHDFDEACDQGMAHVAAEEWLDATNCFERALKLDAKEGRVQKAAGEEVSEERADCAFNLACCQAQLGRLDEAEMWLRRAVAWGVRGVDPLNDDHLAPLRDRDYALMVNLADACRPAPPRLTSELAVLQRSKRSRPGGAMAALIKQEKERMEAAADASDDEEIDEFWKDAKEDDEYSGSAGSEHERRDVFDSDFDEESSESEEEGWGYDDDKGEEKARAARVEARRKERASKRKASEEAEARAGPPGGKRARRAAADQSEARSRAELEADPGGPDDAKDADFKDAAADAELRAGQLAPRARGPTVGDAVRAAKRDKLVASAAADLGLGGDDDGDDADDEAPAASGIVALSEKIKKPKKKKKKKKAADVLAGLFGAKAAATITKKADKAVAARAAAPPPPPKFQGIVRKATAVEKKRFGGQVVEVKKTVRETKEETAARGKHHDRLDSVLDAIAGKKEITTVGKSRAEWDLFKEKEGLEDSLKDAGQKGYLDKQAFMERADHRKFEIERDHRNAERAKRDQAAP